MSAPVAARGGDATNGGRAGHAAEPHLGASERNAHRIADLVTARVQTGHPLRVLGITGPPGTGKSTVATLVTDLLTARGIGVAGLAPMDGFHFSNALLEDCGRADHKGAPDTFDVWGYVTLLTRIREAAHPVLAPEYRRDLHEPVAASALLGTSGLVITEGNYLTLDAPGWREARELMDLVVFIDTPRDEILRRLVARQEAFGRDHVDASHWVRTVDAANIDTVEATAERADVVV